MKRTLSGLTLRMKHNRTIVLLCLLNVLFIEWILFGIWLNQRVWLKAGVFSWGQLAAAAGLSGTFFAWRRWRQRDEPGDTRAEAVKIGLFAGVLSALVLLPLPQAWVFFASAERMQSEVVFQVVHPGPASSRFSRCEAGIVFYDNDLQSRVELCATNAAIPPDSQTLRVSKRLGSLGAHITGWRFLPGSVRSVVRPPAALLQLP